MTMTPARVAAWTNAADAVADAIETDQYDNPLTAEDAVLVERAERFIDHAVDQAVLLWGLDTPDYRAFYDAIETKSEVPSPQAPIDFSNAPPVGTYAFTAWLMAQGGDEDEGDFWDRWKDEMKEASL